MQTIIVTINQQGEKTTLQIDDNVISTISKDFYNKGRFCASFGIFANCNNKRFIDALEFYNRLHRKSFF